LNERDTPPFQGGVAAPLTKKLRFLIGAAGVVSNFNK
jgi:hypothetical protein